MEQTTEGPIAAYGLVSLPMQLRNYLYFNYLSCKLAHTRLRVSVLERTRVRKLQIGILDPEPHPDPRATPPAYYQATERRRFLLGTLAERHVDSGMKQCLRVQHHSPPSVQS